MTDDKYRPAPLHPLDLVNKQADDKELWFQTGQSEEVHFQESLRELHHSVEYYFDQSKMEDPAQLAVEKYPTPDDINQKMPALMVARFAFIDGYTMAMARIKP